MHRNSFLEEILMTSYRFAPSPRNRIAARFIGQIGRELQNAYIEEKRERKITRNQIAKTFGINRAVVSRQLSGRANLTARTIADYAWVLGRDLVFSMPKRQARTGTNQIINVAPLASAIGDVSLAQPIPLSPTTAGTITPVASGAFDPFKKVFGTR
jgi:transcriptional regulator with XRE-family HTH domain